MKCPACRNLMIVVEHHKIELDYCPDCSGVWFDAGELELLFESLALGKADISIDGLLSTPEAHSNEKKRRCPICGDKMRKFAISQKPEVVIDGCPRGDGLWFDKGEVKQLISQIAVKPSPEANPEARIINFLGDVFTIHE